ncbi:alpha/beta hydrolase-fold protein [Actinotalea sp. M2MS4P-6]|uniref:alpha/beta hydrolase-fold protein n=1 Tax=Actinotalea sp. M2MS4P-6 TaxID=2983762 RepID=UPI0021E4DCCC|nr:alpha/beta hydrolase-fold protein [Actinotalea sp. M2MS4P-6]MCV2394397.1 alpha/beta hydrolase-fold protein [Actinotalea sp. M2MS4P-6]
MSRHINRPGRVVAAVIGLGLITASVGASAAVASGPAALKDSHGSSQHDLGPQVRHTGKAPTGYTVTFRYYDPSATRVQIKGEWYFERPSELAQLASTPDYTVETPGIMPADWQPGDVPIASPNSTSPNWPVVDMTERGSSGVWTYTTPLPSGVFSYGFYVDCETADQSGCTEVPDPANPAWDVVDGVVTGAPVTVSQVYVPSDAKFDTIDYSWQAPNDEQGALQFLTYASPGHVNPADSNYLVVYTPPGYDPTRAEPYPTLYLSHGGGEDAMGWSTQGNLANIMDNLIDTGEVQPMVVVMPNGNGYPSSSNNQAYRDDLINTVFPFIEANFNVSADAADRAYSGLSAGGLRTNQLMLYNTDQFGYYGMMSAGLPPGTTLSAEQVAALQQVSVFVGAGWQDPIFAVGFGIGGNTFHTGPAQEVSLLTAAGIHVSTDYVNGGHEWYVWRILLKDFVTRVAFQPLPFATWSTN